jgi:hypothetical protein
MKTKELKNGKWQEKNGKNEGEKRVNIRTRGWK